jgi:tetratricopeptide (TPR) repeat protein
MKVAVYTIAKNEEQFVERWAESSKEADYRFILDTGSSDGTVARAAALGINVAVASINPWRFDDARNVSLALLPDDVDICIALDMDEILVPGWRQILENIRPETTRPRYKYTWSWDGDQPGLQYGADKIHTRHGYRWKHPVHEVITTDRIPEIQEWTDLEIHHFPDHTKSRGQYFPLLELAVEEDPLDDRNSYYLGREYCYHQMWDKAAKELQRYLSLPRAKWPAERAAAMRWLAKCETNNAVSWLKRAVSEDPNRREARVELMQEYYKQEYWDGVLSHAKMVLQNLTEKPMDYLCEAFAWGSMPYDLGALAAYHLKHQKLAIEWGTKAVELSPDDDRLQRNLEWYKGK